MIHLWFVILGHARRIGQQFVTPLPRHDRGQATTEYALVMLGAALVALLVVAWATAGGGAGKIGQLFDRVLDAVLQNVT
jgi:hypothetical protein